MMRHIRMGECSNGWLVEVAGEHKATIGTYNPIEVISRTYVFNDWSEMMEFVEDYFADEEE